MILDLVKLARPNQYIKNLFIFVPAFFAFQLTELALVINAVVAFIAFSMLASAVYIFNDWIDRYDDARHPDKKNRAIASGRVKGDTAFWWLGFLMLGGLAIAYTLSDKIFFIVIAYLVINVAYSLRLKHTAIIDIFIIAIGFILRLMVGAEATQVDLSHWIIVMTFLLALFLSLAKRRDDVLIYIKTDLKMRKVIDGYNLKFLDAAMMMTASITIVAYILWSISPEVALRLNSENLYLTAAFVILGILRYMQIAFVQQESGNPSKVLLKDSFIQLTLLGWVGVFVWLLYL